jgi:SAM-dependent methyltransferase
MNNTASDKVIGVQGQPTSPAAKRSMDRIRFHYEVEKRLARRLIESTPEERRHLYTAVYDELFKTVEDHPQHTVKHDDDTTKIDRQLKLIRPLVKSTDVFLEIGAGDCKLSTGIAPYVKRVVAIDVSPEIVTTNGLPANVEVMISDGTSIPVELGSADFIYSNQLMEHLHPDDAVEQVRNIFKALRPGGRYMCITPNRIHGPHDVSRHFSPVAEGLHLREYSYRELGDLFQQVGFRKVDALVAGRGVKLFTAPLATMLPMETVIGRLTRASKFLKKAKVTNVLLGVKAIAYK